MTATCIEAARLLAPSGVLRAAINLSNPLLVTGQSVDGDPEGVAPSVAAVLAGRLGVELELIAYSTPGPIADAALADEWDIALIGAEPTREATICFTPPYAQIEARFLAHDTSAFWRVDDVDVPGVRVVARNRSAYALWLESHLSAAALVPVDGNDAELREFATDPNSVLAGLAPALAEIADRVQGVRILNGRFTAVRQAVGIPRPKAPATGFVSATVTQAREAGVIASLIERFDLVGKLEVATD